MMSLPLRKPIPFDSPATYQIIVQGRIDPTMSDLIGGMTIQIKTEESSPLVATLKGELRDQAALAGVLNSLYELHLTVISVERLSE
jgi:hypothetical protein